jgi:hypothetical protein
VADLKSQISDLRLQISDCGTPISNVRLRKLVPKI